MAGTALIKYRQKPKPTTLLNSVFMSTVNAATKSLVSVSSNMQVEQNGKWKARDHLRYVVMLMTWTTVWVLRVLMDHFPFPSSLIMSSQKLLGSIGSSFLGTSSTSLLPSCSSMDLILQDDDADGPSSVHALGRSLTHILALLNDIPATSRKYQFAVAMADNIMDGNFREGHAELVEVNRIALSSAFYRTLSLLCRALKDPNSSDNIYGALATRVIKLLPMGSRITSYVKGFNHAVGAVLDTVRNGLENQGNGRRGGRFIEGAEDVVAEKLAQELLWMTQKLRTYGAVDEAMIQWSCAYGLASLSHSANPRVQGYILRISAILIGDLTRDIVVSTQVKFGLLAHWLPLFVHADNGLAGPFLTSFEKLEVERAMDEVIATLPAMDQEIILTNWVQDFAVSASEWPNLRVPYDRWCQSTRELATI